MDCRNKDVVPVEHEEELSVLKAIFNEDFLSVDNENPPFKFDLIIRFDSLLKNIRLIHEESNTSTDLSHLPPITLRIIYKKTYPEIDSPFYRIFCDYLTCNQLLLLVNQMDKMWKPNEVIVYTWIEFLKEYFYNMNNQLILSSMESLINDERFLTNYNQIGSKQIYEQLIEYNRMQNRLEFEQTYHICPICLDEKSGKNCLQFEICNHYACFSCLNSYAKQSLLNIQQQNKQINCYQCNNSLYLSELRRIFSDDKLFLKYQQYLIDMISCPRCHHSIICIPSESQSGNHPSFVECLDCQFTFCRRCEESWHPQTQCPKEKLIENLRETPNETSLQMNKIELKKLLLEIESIQTIEQLSKPCPSCHVRIEKNGGCQHMICRACQVHFCWSCGWYGNSYVPHPCQIKIENFKVLPASIVNEKILYDENGQKIRNDVAKRVQICPRPYCQEVHVKIGTKNMIKCAKCEKYFCFICGEAVYGQFHYSEYGCKFQSAV